MFFPASAESLLGALPRPAIDWSEVHLFPRIPHTPLDRSLRLAFVKSDHCGQVYTRPGGSASLKALAQSTMKTFGPLSLFSRFQTDFFILRLPADPACQIWREFFENDPDPAVSARRYEANRNQKVSGSCPESASQGDYAVDVEAVDWNGYDAVIAQDLCVPPHITRQFRAVFWSYWISETGTRTFKSSFRRPAEGYQAFLNGGSRRWRVRPSLRHHALEFPYILQDSDSHHLLGALPWEKRSGFLLEINTARRMPAEFRRRLESMGPVKENTGTPLARLGQLHHCKYYLQFAENRLWGNAMNEAVAAGCLGLANPQSMPNNRSLMLSSLTPGTWEDFMTILSFLQNNPAKEKALRERQAVLADWYLCNRPIHDWLVLMDRFRGGRLP